MREGYTRTRLCDERQSRAGRVRFRTSARRRLPALIPRVKWRPNWDLAYAASARIPEGVVRHRLGRGRGVGVLAIARCLIRLQTTVNKPLHFNTCNIR
ncbi:unnamed protein product [Arctia plantaginis]|uniref:Uncharacterized protein n=1 Tax=Arctia plantaginis TaxID=874455 RepID=A0A8S0YSD9_ARCPL|nr:unnamed protein product [Arctia plantaginis]